MRDRKAPSPDKAELRSRMRSMRRELSGRNARSAQIFDRVCSVVAVRDARRVLAFSSVPGEPETAPFIAWCRSECKDVALPEDGVDPTWPDVVIVPGLAFTIDGDRLGQGGGWYDRFLAKTRDDCFIIGVGFVEQLVEVLPVEAHDVRLDQIMTDVGVGDAHEPGHADDRRRARRDRGQPSKGT